MNYLIAVKLDDGNEVFCFKSTKARERFIKDLEALEIEYATTEVKDLEVMEG